MIGLGRILLVLCVSFCVVTTASATPIIDVGNHDLIANQANQAIEIYVTGGDSVTGFTLQAQIGDGDGANPEPVFSSISFAGAIWGDGTGVGAGNDAYTILDPDPISGVEMLAQPSLAFNTTGVSRSANGLVVTLLIDTTGFSSGTYDLKLAGSVLGEDSDFAGVAATITNGSITIPEPATLSLLALGGLALIRRRRRA